MSGLLPSLPSSFPLVQSEALGMPRVHAPKAVEGNATEPATGHSPVLYSVDGESKQYKLMALELEDQSVLQGYSFGADKSVSGELVFQTGMVGYPESLTDPSYRGQMLVFTFPNIGNYGVPDRSIEDAIKGIPKYFESNEIHVSAIIISSYSQNYSHFLAHSSLGDWLKEQGIPGIFGIDTRALTKKIRKQGSMLGRLLLQKGDKHLEPSEISDLGRNWKDQFEDISWKNPNAENLTAEVSIKKPKLYEPHSSKALKKADGKTMRIIAVDVGMKYNQIRCFVTRGVELLVVPWDYDYSKEDYDGLFISNGPGDPSLMDLTVERVRRVIESKSIPVFGICFGHQILARAAGASTIKMKFGNRGHNIPCTCLVSGRCYITSQNHGYAVNGDSLPSGWKELYVNANDGSNEGIYNTEYPFFSVQFHPESTPGPRDTEFLFDVFIDTVKRSADSGKLQMFKLPGGTLDENKAKHPRIDAKRVLVLGSGGLSIGQAGEFDYSGSQAIKALREEGIYTILINPNIATIQTSKGLADKVYFLPVNADFVRKVIKQERPDGIYVTFGGQTALNVGIELKDEFESLGVKVLGTSVDTIITTEDREKFARAMDEIDEKCAKSASASSLEEALKVSKDISFPVIVRAAYALGGLGSGFADNEEELTDLCNRAFATSPQVLIERSMKGWKEIEYEVVRDAFGNCITVCNMENFDPLGIHTGDSIVVAPSQTLTDEDYNMLRTTAVNVIRHLGVVGECNIQYALNPFTKEYCIIEVNARLSRSSALASKATGYPLAFTAAKLGLNIPLNEIKNSVTKVTCACFEPSLDYVVVKIPRWDLKKFTRVSTQLSSSMKSVGEVMSIGRTFEEAIQKAIRAIDHSNGGFNVKDALMSIDQELQTPSDQRLFAIANAMNSGYTVERIWKLTNIDRWFLEKLMGLIRMAKEISKYDISILPVQLLRTAKQLGFADVQIASFMNSNELAVRRIRTEAGIRTFVKQIDTVAAEFPAFTNYLYTTYNASEHDIHFEDKGVMVLGSGVYRIGSSVEFDWCAVRTVRTLRDRGIKTIMVNYNPETVSTDFDEADRLYFENISLETVLDIYQQESSSGVIISMGGQTSNNIALPLYRENVKILGTSPEMIDGAENRFKFSRMLDDIGVDQPKWKELTSFEEAEEFCERVSYPVLVRPSYVLSGAAMNTVYSKTDLQNYLKQAVAINKDHPVVISKYIENAKEIELDAVARDGRMVMHVISEHVENAGVHSGDATLVLPPQDLDPATISRIVDATAKIGEALNITGPYNIQFIAKDNEIKVIECNVRASRSFPFVSKVMGADLISMATDVIMGFSVKPYPEINLPRDYVAVKVPQFSFSRLSGADPVLGVEMASTGEVACFGHNKFEAYLKAMISTGFRLPKQNILISIGSYKEKAEFLPYVRRLYDTGYNIFATAGTSDYLMESGVPCKYLADIPAEEANNDFSLSAHLANNMIDMYINLPSNNRYRRPANYISSGYKSRRLAIDYSVPLVTNVKCAKLMVEAICRKPDFSLSSVDYQSSFQTENLPGLINIGAYLPEFSAEAISDYTEECIAAGFTMTRFLPFSKKGVLADKDSLANARKAAIDNAHCDYNFSVVASFVNEETITDLKAESGCLYLHFENKSSTIDHVTEIASHFSLWPQTHSVVTDAKSTTLASVLLLASLHNRRIHVASVTSKDDINLIVLAKQKSLPVTFDVSIYSLFLTQSDYPGARFLPTPEDQKELWNKLEYIDCFSIGSVPVRLAEFTGHKVSTGYGIREALPLLLSAVHDGRLSLNDVVDRLYTNPKEIFRLHEQDDSGVQIETDRAISSESAEWSPLTGKKLFGSVQSVKFGGHDVYFDGELNFKSTNGRDYSSSNTSEKPVSTRKASALMSPGLPHAAPSLAEAFGQAPENRARPELTFNFTPSFSPSRELVNMINSSPFYRKHIISVHQVTRSDLHLLFAIAHQMRIIVERQGVIDLCYGKILCTMFFESSTRTSSSFDAAMQRLGGKVVAVTASASSVNKGESLADTIRTLGCYGDAIVLRHPSVESARIAATFSPVPIINGGNGSKEHPTQAFLDLYTIREELGSVNGLTITFVGDLKYGRTVHSLARLLAFWQVELHLVSPEQLQLPDDVKEDLRASGLNFIEHRELSKDVVAQSDVLYCTRVQKERFSSIEEYEELKDSFIVDNNLLTAAKPHTIVMHPLPRNREISEEVDFDQKRAAYFRQMRYGLYIRMALLACVMGASESHN
ncbi:carbamoyl-phosphate synthase (glutamine hydrolyzing), aspartate carbamoyltransferase Ura1 [Schizosaccharomyces osmophilus]|uniref:Pyrimidine-specific carbamoyl phosphate synthase-aspartate carbamoyl transferase n=1 Tax=Schizosaccharomyces osmophilus TaxID=2545709 RepID=A0AAF0ASC3_9SCHI|nr:carbamoyl-phosphate synthase (glutamine hydrolyzing), aspartate carbamoyltransferase Ura1 [Schizosaccharomyces osmophilus]WBW70906.1 carbamoyl-phosphate synthase (glutamine hydrolyzing), aspartate carbamoyltransferase Ura1 [Schizosaccharomyces osmophilus]